MRVSHPLADFFLLALYEAADIAADHLVHVVVGAFPLENTAQDELARLLAGKNLLGEVAHQAGVATPAKRGKGKKIQSHDEAQDQTPTERRASIPWSLPHIHVLRDTGTSCPMAVLAHPCAHGISASMHVITCIEDPVVIKKIRTQLNEKTAPAGTGLLPECRAPLRIDLFDGP